MRRDPRAAVVGVGIEPWFAVFQSYGDHFPKMAIELVDRISLPVCAGRNGCEIDPYPVENAWLKNIIDPAILLDPLRQVRLKVRQAASAAGNPSTR